MSIEKKEKTKIILYANKSFQQYPVILSCFYKIASYKLNEINKKEKMIAKFLFPRNKCF